jgi:hypothetical protein
LTIKFTRSTGRPQHSAVSRNPCAEKFFGPRLLLIARSLVFLRGPCCPLSSVRNFNHKGHDGYMKKLQPRTPAGLRHS